MPLPTDAFGDSIVVIEDGDEKGAWPFPADP
jgi:hypothetical protein